MNTLALAASVALSNTIAQLQPVIVEASRLDVADSGIASHIDVIDSVDIESPTISGTVDLLEKRANIFVRKVNSNPLQSQISMRGYGANGFGRVKVVVDGVEMNNADMSPQNLAGVPLHSIRKVEIMHGPQSVLHGGNASAGVVNILTDSDSDEERRIVEARVGSFGSAGARVSSRGAVGSDGLVYSAQVDFDRSDGWRSNSGHEILTFNGGVRHIFDEDNRWALNAIYTGAEYGLPGGIFTGGGYGDWRPVAREAGDTESSARNNILGLSFFGKTEVGMGDSLSLEMSVRHRGGTSYGYLENDASTFRAGALLTDDSTLFGGKNRFDVGTDLSLDLLDSDARSPMNDYGTDNEYSRFVAAVFARDESWLRDDLSVFAGLRCECFDSRDRYETGTSDGRDSSADHSMAGEAGINWRPSGNWHAYAKWSRFFHAPLADELFSAYGVPNMELLPEEGDDIEVGFDLGVGKGFTFGVAGFETELDDEIVYMNSANRNAPDPTSRMGMETWIRWDDDELGSIGVMYSHVDAKFKRGRYKGNEMPMVPEQLLRVFGEVDLLGWLTLGGGYRFVGRQRCGSDWANEGGHLPSFGIFDAGIKARPQGLLDGFVISFVVDNVFDKRYCDYAEYIGSRYVYPASGRSMMLTVGREF